MCQGKEGSERGERVPVCMCVCVFVCEYMSVCCIRSGQEKQSDQRPHGCKCQACQRSNL